MASAAKPEKKKDKKEWIVLIIAFLLLLVVGGVIVGVMALIASFPAGFGNRDQLHGDPNAGGCYVVDSAFTAIKSTSADDVLAKLSRYNNLKNKKPEIQKIIDQSNAAGINYYLLLDIWSGEQSFGNDAAAFGCGVYGGQNRFSGFDSQLGCAIEMIKKAINNVSPYNQPTGANTFTRLFYTYTAGMQENYQKFGYVAGADNPRIVIHQLLASSEVVCSAGGAGPGVALVGDKLYPPLGPKMDGYLTYNNHSTWCCRLCTACAVDYAASGGTPIYAVADGTVSNLHPYTSGGDQYRGYTLFFNSSDGQVYATYAHLNPSGSLSTADVRPKTILVKKGGQLGVVYPGLNSPHLHFELKINGQTMGIPDGKTNNQLQYFGGLK